MREALKDKDVFLRGLVVTAMADLSEQHAEALEVLGEAMKDRDARVRFGAAQALLARRVAAVPVLIKLLESGPVATKAMAAGVLAELGFEAADAVPALQALAKGPNPQLRQVAAFALSKIEEMK
jgi:HEAT repeat protein